MKTVIIEKKKNPKKVSFYLISKLREQTPDLTFPSQQKKLNNVLIKMTRFLIS